MRRRQIEMKCAVDHVKIVLTALYRVPNFANFGLRNLVRRTRKRVDTPHLLHGRRRNRKQLTADSKENDLFTTYRLRLDGSGESHYFTPTGVLTPTGAVLLRPMTRFSIAA